MEFTGYNNLVKIYSSNNTVILRAWDIEKKRSVIIKQLNKPSVSSLDLEKFKQEYNINALCKSSNIVEIYNTSFEDKPFFFTMEDINGYSLSDFIQKRRVQIAEFLKIAILIVRAVRDIHSYSIIHKDINPFNIIYNPANNNLKIIDFGISTEFSREDQTMINPEVLEGTLKYIAPEQTGRMNRSIDYRSDFYSLGVTLYHLVTGKLPFPFDDSLELVHAHIAVLPKNPGIIRSDIPEEISKIIMHLLEKNAEDRYQSIDGILYDIEECERQYSKKRIIKKFTIASHDHSNRFQISQKLYGRNEEIKKIMDSFDWISNGHCESLFISGETGVGKSSLVKELYKPVTAAKGYFLYGKYEQLKKDIPYKGIIEASKELIQNILAESEEKVERWRKLAKSEIGEDIEILYELIPEVQLISGRVLKIRSITPEEREVKLKQIFLKVFKMLSGNGFPVVFVLDDLQWVDNASVNLLRYLLSSGELKNFFLIGTFRTNEITKISPVIQIMDNLMKSENVINEMELYPLNENDVVTMLVDTFNHDDEDVDKLAELICKKTGGNPFFINEFLISLYDEKLIEFNSGRLKWQWDIEKINNTAFTENVINLMTNNISRLDPLTKKVLMNASCIGARFDFPTLNYITDEDEKFIYQSLKDAINRGYLIPISNNRAISTAKTTATLKSLLVDYKFTHDRILQAAGILMSEQEMKEIHRKIGFYYLTQIEENEKKDKIFEIVNHLNYSRDSIETSVEKYEMAVLNYKAALKAKSSAAYEIAFNYIKHAFRFFPEQAWSREYEASFEMHLKGMEIAMQCGEYSYMFQISQIVEKNCKGNYDYILYRMIILKAFMAENKLPGAIEEAGKLLKLLGISIPEKFRKFDLSFLFLKIRFLSKIIKKKRIEKLICTKNRKYDLSMKILSLVSSAFYYSETNLFPYIVLKQIELSFRHGNTPESAQSYITYALFLCGLSNKQKDGSYFGNLAMRLAENPECFLLRPRIRFLYYTFVSHWVENYEINIQSLLETYNMGMEIGDYEYAANAIYIYGIRKYVSGFPLKQLADEIEYYGKEILKINQKTTFNYNEIHRQTILNLCTIRPNPENLTGEAYDEELSIPLHKKNKDRTAMCLVYVNKLILAFNYEKFDKCEEYLSSIKKYESAIQSTVSFTWYKFYECLYYIRKYEVNENKSNDKNLKKKIKKIIKNFEIWKNFSDIHFLFYYQLLKAEYYKINGKEENAIKFYNAAIETADFRERNNEQALGNELCAKYFYRIGKLNIAKAFMSNSVNHYLNWQAEGKVDSLKKLYPEIINTSRINPDHYIIAGTVSVNSGSSKAELLDFSSVMKASMAISGEIKISTLLNKMIRILIENAGAQKGNLLLKRKNDFFLVAQGDITVSTFEVMQNLPFKNIEYDNQLPSSIINYVIRLKIPVVLANAAKSKFYNDKYVENNKPLSVLCMPIKYHDEVIAVLYLENNSLESAFSENRLETLKFICAQAAISLQNADFYEQLEEYSNGLEAKVKERTSELENTNNSLIEIYEQLSEARITAHNDLLLAGNVQRSLLPQKNPDDSEWEISFLYKSMTGVSGDFYDFYEVDKRLRGVGLFDVSGHGISSGLVTVLSKSIIHNYFIEHINDKLDETIYQIDEKLSQEIGHSGNYLTGVLLRLDENKISYVNAGHPQLLIKRISSTTAEKVTKDGDENSWRGSFIGMPFIRSDFGVVEFEMQSGDYVLLYTDCLYEATDDNNQPYGINRLMASMEDAPMSNTDDTLNYIINCFNNFTNSTELDDDLTVILVRKK